MRQNQQRPPLIVNLREVYPERRRREAKRGSDEVETSSLHRQRDLLLYHGFTTNIERRIREHNEGATISTSKRRPLGLVYCEFFLCKKDAMRRERYFKTTQGKRMLKLLLRDTLVKIKYPR